MPSPNGHSIQPRTIEAGFVNGLALQGAPPLAVQSAGRQLTGWRASEAKRKGVLELVLLLWVTLIAAAGGYISAAS